LPLLKKEYPPSVRWKLFGPVPEGRKLMAIIFGRSKRGRKGGGGKGGKRG